MAIYIRIRQLLNDRTVSMDAVAKGTGFIYPTHNTVATKPITRIDREMIDQLGAFLPIQPDDHFMRIALEHAQQEKRSVDRADSERIPHPWAMEVSMPVSFETLVQVLPTLTKQQKQTLFVLLQAEYDQDAHLHALNQQFWREPTLDALIAEQQPRVIQSLDDFAAPWWPTDESVDDFETFLAESRTPEASHE